jgi:hypothetical protein
MVFNSTDSLSILPLPGSVTGLHLTDKKNCTVAGSVAHVCNPIYFRGGDQKYLGSRPAQAKVSDTPISIKKSDMMVHACGPNYMETVGRWISV